MTGGTALQRAVMWVLDLLARYRYIKFGIVGASGTVVNVVVLHYAHTHLFDHIETTNKPYLSLALAISLATINNFSWNRLWTWSDRVKTLEAEEGGPSPGHVSLHLLGLEFGQYITASAFGSGLQYVLTILLSNTMDLRIANILAILAASVSNFLANDRWTFKREKK